METINEETPVETPVETPIEIKKEAGSYTPREITSWEDLEAAFTRYI